MRNATTLYAKKGEILTVNGNSGEIRCEGVDLLAVDILVSAASGTSPTINFYVQRKDANGNWVTLYAFPTLSAASSENSNIGPGATTPKIVTGVMRVIWELGGVTPSFTTDISVIGASVG